MIRTWWRSHNAGWPLLMAIVASLSLGAWATAVAARRVAPDDVLLDMGGSDPALLGPVILAVACGLPAVLLEDRMAWMTDVSARRLGVLRVVWGCLLISSMHLIALLTSPLIARGVQADHVFWSFLPLWLGAMLLAAVAAGPVVGSLAPITACLFLSLRALPWEANVAFNPALLEWRWGAGITMVFFGIVLYGLRGVRRARGRVRRD